MDYIGIHGDFMKVQSNLDFYLRLTSTKGIKSNDALRKTLFRKFLDEERERSRELYELEESLVSCIEVEDVAEIEEIEQGTEETVKDLEDIEVVTGKNIDLDMEEGNEDVAEDVVASSVGASSFLNLVKQVTDSKEEIVNEEKEYISHGKYIDEDLEDSDELEDAFEDEEDFEWDEPEESYVKDLDEEEDVFDEESEDAFDDEEWSGEDAFENEEEWTGEDEEVTAEEIEDDFEDSDWDSLEASSTSESIEEAKDSESDSEEEWLVDNTEDAKEKFVSDTEDLFSPEDVQKREFEGVKPEVSIVDDGKNAVDVPQDLRVFLKQHPNSDISYVQQFYPKKIIDQQLKLGRIYKKRGKLMI